MIVSFSSVKGGVGKTVSCVNLAYYIGTQKNKSVLIIDLDCQAGATHNLSAKFNKKFRASLYDVLVGKSSIEKAIHNYEKLISFIPINYKFNELVNNEFEIRFKNLIEKIKKQYDFIFLDLSPAIYSGTTIPLSVSDKVVIPVDCPGGLGLLGLETAAEQIKEIRNKKNISLDVLGILPCFVDHTKVSKDVLSYLQSTYPNDIFPSIRRNASIAQASSLGKTIFEYKEKAIGAEDYKKVGQEFMRRVNNHE